MTGSTCSSTTPVSSTPSSARAGPDRVDGPEAGGRTVPADDPAHARTARRRPSRVITVSSSGMYTQRLDLATLLTGRPRGCSAPRHGPGAGVCCQGWRVAAAGRPASREEQRVI
jgi:hypothetical protein